MAREGVFSKILEFWTTLMILVHYEDFVIFLLLSSSRHLLLTLGLPISCRGPRSKVLFYSIIFILQQRFKMCCA